MEVMSNIDEIHKLHIAIFLLFLKEKKKKKNQNVLLLTFEILLELTAAYL